MTVHKTNALTAQSGAAIFSAQGHGHADLSQGIADSNAALLAHGSAYVHLPRVIQDIPLCAAGEDLIDGQVLYGVTPITGYVTRLYGSAVRAASGSAATAQVQTGPWGGTLTTIGTLSFAAGTRTAELTTMNSSVVVKDNCWKITIDADSGGGLGDAWLRIEMSPGDVTLPDPLPLGRVVNVAWDFDAADESTITRFEILRDGAEVWRTTDVTARTASLFFYWNSVYSLRSCSDTECSDIATPVVAVFAPGYAVGSAATASTTATGSLASNAVDGRSSTYWLSGTGQTQSLQLDLGQTRDITGYRMHLGTPSTAEDWTFQTSSDGTSWSTEHTVIGNADQIVIVDGLSETARYVKWAFTKSASTRYAVAQVEIV